MFKILLEDDLPEIESGGLDDAIPHKCTSIGFIQKGSLVDLSDSYGITNFPLP